MQFDKHMAFKLAFALSAVSLATTGCSSGDSSSSGGASGASGASAGNSGGGGDSGSAGTTSSLTCAPDDQAVCACDDGLHYGFTTCDSLGAWGACTGCAATDPCAGCTGCCNQGTCVPLQAQGDDTCGTAAADCTACSGGDHCVAGQCTPPVAAGCSPSTCPSGCCLGDFCIEADNQDAFACGASGAVCSTCTYGTLCSEGSCTDTIDASAIFQLNIDLVVVTDHSAAGETWDPLGGLPDPMVCATNLSGQTGCTAPCQDQTTCVPVPGLVMNGSSPLILTGYELVNGFTLQVLDSDAAYNDVIWTGTLTPNSLSSGSAQPGDTLVSLSWSPQPYGT